MNSARCARRPAAARRARLRQRPGPARTRPSGVVATSAPLTAGQTQRLAVVANDGLARAIRPAHEPVDGDTVFGVTLVEDPATVEQSRFVEFQAFRQLLAVAADTYSRAIVHAVLNANPALGETYCERFDGACPDR